MHKTIDVRDLRVGMYIASLGNTALAMTDSVPMQGLISSDQHIATLSRCGLRQVVIDTARGRDVGPAQPVAPLAELLKGMHASPRPRSVPLRQELEAAHGIYADALAYMQTFMAAVTSGAPIRIDLLRTQTTSMLQSLERNSDALMALSTLRESDESTYQHSVRVSVLAMTYARYLGAEGDALVRIGMAGMLHDVGMTQMPKAILKATRPLTEEELTVLRGHPLLGRKRLAGCVPPVAEDVLAAVGQHHERFDGTGYPDGLRAAAITPMAQIIGLADSYDGLTSPRSYKVNLIPSRALSMLYATQQQAFAPGMVERFIKCMGVYPLGSLVRLDDGRIGVVCESSSHSPARPHVRLVQDRTGHNILPKDIDLTRLQERRVVECLSPREVNVDPAAVLLN